MSKALMIQGTSSGAGKSAVVAGLCRIFRDMGIRVAPFKAQNMALNSFITRQGGEIGRAQAFQAEAAGIEPANDMNPVLLKATGEAGSQVILNGKVYATMKARDYYTIKDKIWEEITAAYDRLSRGYDLIIIEGAGSPAEINLREEEVVNMKMARYAGAPVILVGDIDRGGVFASFYGTVELLKDPPVTEGEIKGELSDADYIRAFVVNKFRGDMDILRPGLRMIEKKTGKLVIGVLGHYGNLGLDEEDGLSLERITNYKLQIANSLKIVVLRLKYISNFTDFAPFMNEPDVELKYSLREEDIMAADLIIIPGSKNTVSDLLLVRESGLEEVVKTAARKKIQIAGICGGYQMLGNKIMDPHGVESGHKRTDGMKLLDIITTLDRTKTTCQVEAEAGLTSSELGVKGGSLLKGYEIHMGNSEGDIGLFMLKRSFHDSGLIPDGSLKGNVWGTYIHGIFDNDEFRTGLLNSLRQKKGLPKQAAFNYFQKKEEAINKWAGILKDRVDICFIMRQLGMEYCGAPFIKDKI